MEFKVTAKIGSSSSSWNESFEMDLKTDVLNGEAKTNLEEIVNQFNSSLGEGEEKRHLVSIVSIDLPDPEPKLGVREFRDLSPLVDAIGENDGEASEAFQALLAWLTDEDCGDDALETVVDYVKHSY